MATRISLKRVYRCGGKDRIMLTVSIIHPRRTCNVDQVQSPVSILFRYKTSFWLDLSVGYRVWNTLSSVWNKVRWTWRRLYPVPWDRHKRGINKDFQVGSGIHVVANEVGIVDQPFH